jgi:trehalose 6-phosphate synthase/phosphatase
MAVSVFHSVFGDAPFTIVSNREPYVPRWDEAGNLTYDKPAGGLTAALDPVMRATGGTWIAWGSPAPPRPLRAASGPSEVGGPESPRLQLGRTPERLAVPPENPAYEVRRVRLTDREVRNYYHGYSNESLWPLCHHLLEHVRFRDRFWSAYRDVNRKFADVALEEAADSRTLIWLHDYHLALAPEWIRQARSEARLAQFWHIPWPAWEIFRVCPNHRELLEGLLANDLLAFHLDSFCLNFIRCCEQALDVVVDRRRQVIVYGGHVTTVRALPISIDAESFRDLASRADTEERIAELRHRFALAGRQVGIGVDRLDYSKGILERIEALRILFRRHPEHVGRFTFIQIGAPSRTEIPAYAALQGMVEEAVARLNRSLETPDWRPVLYISRGFAQEELAAFYRMADVAIVSSLQDGMNLVAKEFVAAQVDLRGVLCLSMFAGAAEEFEHAIPINPFYTEGFAQDIHRALIMDPAEKRVRMEGMQARLEQGNVYHWIADFFRAARESLDIGRRRLRSRSRRPRFPPSTIPPVPMEGTPTEGVAIARG